MASYFMGVVYSGLITLLVLWCLSAIGYYFYTIYATVRFFNRSLQLDSTDQPPVTILKPICGLDWNAYENLATFCQQDYPIYQVVFGVLDEKDLGITVVQQIIHDFPLVDIQLVVSDRTIGKNLKVSNLANAELEAKHPILVIADSDIRVTANYLQQIVHPLHDPAVGVVTCTYRCVPQGAASTFEALIITTEYHPILFINHQRDEIQFAIGSTIVIRRSVLDEIGGFAAIADYLEDDSQLGYRPTQLGYRVVLSNYIVDHVTGETTWYNSIQRMVRWACGTRFSDPSGYPKTILTRGTIASLLLLITMKGAAIAWIILAVTWIVRYSMGWVVGVWGLRDSTARKFLWLAPLGDLVSFAIWCYGFVGTTVEWRGQRLKLMEDGKLKSLT